MAHLSADSALHSCLGLPARAAPERLPSTASAPRPSPLASARAPPGPTSGTRRASGTGAAPSSAGRSSRARPANKGGGSCAAASAVLRSRGRVAPIARLPRPPGQNCAPLRPRAREERLAGRRGLGRGRCQGWPHGQSCMIRSSLLPAQRARPPTPFSRAPAPPRPPAACSSRARRPASGSTAARHARRSVCASEPPPSCAARRGRREGTWRGGAQGKPLNDGPSLRTKTRSEVGAGSAENRPEAGPCERPAPAEPASFPRARGAACCGPSAANES